MAVPNAYNKLVGEVGAIVEPKVLFLSLPFEKKIFNLEPSLMKVGHMLLCVC